MISGAEMRVAAGRVGEAVARRLYPAAHRPNGAGGTLDFILPCGSGIEAKCVRLRGSVYFRDAQIVGLRSPGARCVISVYDDGLVRHAPGGMAPDLAVLRAVRCVFDLPGRDVEELVNAEGAIRAVRVVKEAALQGRVRVIPSIDLTINGNRYRRWLVPLLVRGESPELDLRTLRQRHGWSPPQQVVVDGGVPF